jgi:glucose dehydrogenase
MWPFVRLIRALQCHGGSVWSSPTIDPTRNLVFFGTGNPDASDPLSCASMNYSQSLVALDATTLTLRNYWQLPGGYGKDYDFGSMPTFFPENLGGLSPTDMVGIARKAGYYFAFREDDFTMPGDDQSSLGLSNLGARAKRAARARQHRAQRL